MKAVSVTLYEFKELSAEAQKKVLIDLADINVFFDEGKGDEELVGDANVIATIEANDYWFMEDGTVFKNTLKENVDSKELEDAIWSVSRGIPTILAPNQKVIVGTKEDGRLYTNLTNLC